MQNYRNSYSGLFRIFHRVPQAKAQLAGSENYPEIRGWVRFYAVNHGVLVAADIENLPYGGEKCADRVFGFHIHEGEACTGNGNDPFADVLGHYNPNGCDHPFHSGDMPPLFGAKGRAFSVFLTDRFTIDEIVGKTIIIHGSPDDFTTQPSGNAGEKIACGVINKF